MFEFVKNWIFKRILNRHRLLFRFWDGRKYVAADPFVLLRKLLSTTKFDPEGDLKKLAIPDTKIITTRIGYIAEGVREIFDLPPFRPDGRGGLTELECVNLLMEFTGYLERVKKNGGSNLISVASTVPESANPMESGEVGANGMNENSGSGSTAVEPVSSERQTLPLESEQS